MDLRIIYNGSENNIVKDKEEFIFAFFTPSPAHSLPPSTTLPRWKEVGNNCEASQCHCLRELATNHPHHAKQRKLGCGEKWSSLSLPPACF